MFFCTLLILRFGNERRKNMANKCKKIYDKNNKKWYTISDEFYKAHDRYCNTTRKRMQYQGHCWCPKGKWWLCDAHCLDCEFYISSTDSLDEPIFNDDGSNNGILLDHVADTKAIAEKIISDRNLLQYLCAKLRELDPEADKLITIWRNHPDGISDRKLAKMLGRPQRTFADEMKRFRKKYHHLIDD